MKEIEGFRLSPQQEHLWILQGQGGCCVSQCAAAFEGELRLDLLREVLGSVVRRHEILRTRFEALSGMEVPLQVIAEECPLACSVVDLGRPKVAWPDGEIARLLEQQRTTAFDFTRGPLVRWLLLSMGEGRNVLVVTLPSISADRASLENIIAEVSRAYSACSGAAGSDDEEALQYVQVSEWQNELLQDPEAEQGLRYWQRKAPAEINPPTLPLEVAESHAPSSRHGVVKLEINGERLVAAERVAQSLEISLRSLLLGCWGILIDKLDDQENVVLEVLFDGRELEELREGIGLFRRYIPVELQFHQRSSVGQELQRIDALLREFREWEDLFVPNSASFETGLDQRPVSFDFEAAPNGYALNGSGFDILQKHHVSSNFKLQLLASQKPGRLSLEVHFDPKLFDRGAVERLAEGLTVLLAGVLEAPNSPIDDLEILGETERQMLAAWNETRGVLPEHRTLVSLFEERVERCPEAVAVDSGEGQLSFRELDRRVNRLSHRLRKLSVGTETRVALCLERSADQIVGLLGILKAGAAYVPIDPQLPPDRLAFILEDVEADVVLVHETFKGDLYHDGVEVALDTDWRVIEEESTDSPVIEIAGSNLAYVIYTSGSTGRPKGTLVEHRSVVNLASALSTAVYAEESAAGPLRVGINAPLSFDGSVKQVIQLFSGHTLCIVPEALRLEADKFLDWLNRRRVDVLDITPSQLEILLSAGLAADPEERSSNRLFPRLFLVGGEAFDEPLWRNVANDPLRRFFNVYGPTECTVDTTVCPVHEDRRPTLGKPLTNVQVHVVDSRLGRLPIGVAGELAVGGSGLTRGYLERPGVTAEKFIPDPWGGTRGARLYLTGDRVHFLADGHLAYLGRLDDQVKLRGVRIELGEISALLQEHPEVREAIVVLGQNPLGEQRLVGYVVLERRSATAEPEAEVTSLALREYLRLGLPEVMVPSSIVALEKMPLTSRGKVDRAALPLPDGPENAEEHSVQEARTPTEELLTGVWTELLKLTGPVGVGDSFFDLGGHSLLATQLMSRVRSLFGVELPLRILFEQPTVEGLAAELETASRRSPRRVAPPIERLGRERAPLSFAQQRLWFIDQLAPESAAYNIASGLRFKHPLDPPVLSAAFGELVRRHESLRTIFPSVGGKPVQQILPPAPMALPVVDLGRLLEADREGEARRLAAAETALPFNLARSSALRAELVRLGSADWILLVTMHHIASDGWSMAILTRELPALHEAFAAGRPSPLPELSIQYADYAIWQQRWLRGEVLEAEIEHWRRQLTGAPPLLEIPTDRPRLAVPSYRGATQSLRFASDLAGLLTAFNRRQGVTLFMTLLTAFQALLSRWSGHKDICVGTPIAGRNRLETEGLIGFFINTLVLRARFEGDPDVSSLMAQVRETTFEAHAHQDLPFEKLVEELQPDRSQSHSPLFQVMFGLQNMPRREMVDSAEPLPVLEAPIQAAKFDFGLAMVEGQDRLTGTLIYAIELFDTTTIARFLHQLECLLRGLVESPERRVSSLPVSSEAERHQLLVEWNKEPGDERSIDRSIAALFEEQVAKRPEAIAAVFADQRLSFAALNRRAEVLAGRLRASGVGRGDFVALLVERSPALLVALVGILKAGGAYVPLDPDDPPERLFSLLEEIEAPVLLHTSQHPAFPHPVATAPLRLDASLEAVAGPSRSTPRNVVSGADAAYVIFTSGSTGRPKGVVVPQRAVVRLVRDTDYVRLSPKARIAQASVATFDAATFEIWGALLNGATLIGVAKDELLSSASLSASIRRQRIDTLFLTTALFNQLSVEDPSTFAEVGDLLFGGEAVDPTRVAEVLARRGPGRLLHVYGPTENTTFTTWHRVTAVAQRARTVAIGRPIAHSSIRVLDRELRPVPVGLVGELLIGGQGLSLGYFERPRLNAANYVPDPCGEPGSRLYRSGDLVRWRVDGTIEFVGRVDHQIKLRGFRIELGEIEAVLSTHPWVRETVVVLRHDPPAPKRLIAYWAGAGTSAVDEGRLRDFLVPKLPEYMVPAAFVRLEALPLNINGKVDRAALPVPAPVTGSKPATAAPRTPTEEILSGIWSEVLGVEEVGVDDDFFESGGHSLMATQVISRIHQAFQVRLSVNAMFEAPTLKELAAQIETKIRGDQGIAAPPIEPVSREQALPLSFAQQRLWFIDQLEPGSSAYNIPSALRFDRALDPAVLAAA
ncbi:MAG: amino acid adenylation domain-containing protein, partial [Acidobacteriota bacterium]